MSHLYHNTMYRLASALLLSGLTIPLPVNSQIASPVNAGLNSGDSAFGSSRTNIGTPNFTEGRIQLLVSGLRLEPDGSIVAPGDAITQIQNRLSSGPVADQAVARLLGPLLSASAEDTGDASAIQELSANLIGQLVESGLNREAASQLVTSLVGLANQSSLNQLGKAINQFNSILKTASPELRSALSQNGVFKAIGDTLRAGRNALDSRGSFGG